MKKTAEYPNKSLKTLYLYVLLVIIFICISLAIKGFYVIQQSKVDLAHLFVLAITQQNSVKEIIAFHPETPSIAVLVLQNNITYTTLASRYGITTDGYIQAGDATTSLADVSQLLWSSIIHTGMWKSNLTLYDKIRLLFFVRTITTSNKQVENMNLNDHAEIDATIVNALTDQDIATENNTIQIINATKVTGLGLRLGRVLTNLGANVIDISTARKVQDTSTIEYVGDNSYTLIRLQKLLHLTATKIPRRSIATIVITIGNDTIQTKQF